MLFNENFPLKTARHLIAYPSLVTVLMLAGCALQSPWLPTSGPSTQAIREYVPPTGISIRVGGIRVVEVDSSVAQRVKASLKRKLFSEVFVMAPATDFHVGGGDTLEVSIWEAPPATLFGTAPSDPRTGPATSTLTAFPEQMVNMAGQINVPFAGAIPVIGKTTAQIEVEIAKRLKGKANQPQVLVRVMKNASSNVTVVGDFANSTNIQLTAKRERLLDAVAAAGGVRQPVSKMTVELTRKSTVMSLPLETIIHDPRQNIVLQAGDVVTALNKPLSFLVLGATGKTKNSILKLRASRWHKHWHGPVVCRMHEPTPKASSYSALKIRVPWNSTAIPS